MFDILTKLIEINTINDKDNNIFIEYISSFLSKRGFTIQEIKDKEGNKCLVAKTHDICTLGFLGHSDTVDVSNNWNTEPLKLTIKDSNLYGRGVCDMKGGIAAFLDIVNDLDISKLKKGLMIIITFDEEIGFKGINLIKDRDDIPNNILIGEPTDLEPIAFLKGCMEFNAKFYGKSVHSSVMPFGDNAILSANKFISELLDFSKKLENEKNNGFTIPYTTMNVAIIKGGTSINIVPDECNLSFDFRTVFSEQHQVIINKINELGKKYNSNIDIITNVYPSNNEDKEKIKVIEKITGKKVSGMNYVTEGNFLVGKNVVVLGPGPVTAHEDNEHISISSYNTTKEFYKKIIEEYCMR